MVKNIINQNITDYGEDITTTNNPTTMTEMLGRYPGMDRIQELQNLDYKNNPRDMATGTASDFRHAAAMNELSKSLSPGFVPDVVGDALAYGLGAINEIPDAFRGFSFREGFNPQAKAAALEDLAANRVGTFGTPNTATIEDVFAKTLGYQAPGTNVVTQTASTGPFNYGTAQAAEVNIPDTISGNFGTPGSVITDGAGTYEVNPDGKTASLIGRPNMSDIAGLGDLGNPTGDSRVVSEEMGMTGTPNFGRPSMADIAGQINENLIDRGNPFNDSRVVSEEQGLVGGIPDRGRGMPGAPTGAYEMIGGTPVAVGDVLGRQQALEKADFVEETPQGINLGGILNAAALFGGPLGFAFNKPALSAAGAIGNIATGRFGRAVDRAKSGLGSLGSKFAGTMRGINPATGRPNTQAQYEQNRADRQAQSRTDNMIDRISRGKTTRSNPRDAGKTKSQKDAISAAIQDSHRGGGSGGSSSSKIVCTMMNERYGFGSFRNKIWMKFHEHHGPEYQKGYHAIFLPLVKIAKGEGKINTAVRKVLEHMGRHVTADMFKIMKGKKRDTLGRIYRAIFEPACHIIGKIKSALGRG